MKKAKRSLIAALILSLPVWLNMYWWMANWDSARSFAENKSAYLSRFPKVLQDATLLSLCDIILTAVSIFLLYQSQKNRRLRNVSLLLIVIDAIVFLSQVFSLS